MKRAPSVAGMFYPGNPTRLKEVLDSFFGPVQMGGMALGIVSPHAGYVYSGKVAAVAFSSLPSDFQGTIVLIGPSHAGYSTCTSSVPWETPLGQIQVDSEFVQYLDITIDEFSHRDEHSIEVQVPFIQYCFPDARIVPVMMGHQSLSSALHLASKIKHAITATGREVRVVASSDFSHYVPENVAKKQDVFAIEALRNLDVEEFYRRIVEEGVSACGYGPIATMVDVCKSLGATRGELIKYATSAEETGDASQVVGYAAIAVM